MAGKADGSVIINTKMDTQGFSAGVADMKSNFSGLGTAIKKIGGIMASVFAVGKLVQFGKEAVQLGSDLAEVQNVVDVVFEDLSGEVNEFAKNAITQFGISETAAKQYSSTMGAMLKSMGLSKREAADMGMTIAGLAADMASFYNIRAEEAFYKIRAGISGETEPLKQLGINLNVANLQQYALTQGITKSYNAMTQQEQALLRYNYLLSVTADAQGDFARTSDSWANQTRVLSERFNALKATIGQGLINIFLPVIKVINTLLGKLETVANAFKAFTELITGNKASAQTSVGAGTAGLTDLQTGYDSAASGAEDYTDATTNAAKATKKAAKETSNYLSGLDEIARYEAPETSTGTSSGATGGNLSSGGLTAGATVDYGNLAEGQNVIDDASKSFDKLKEKLSPVVEKLQDIWDKIKDICKVIGEDFKWVYDEIIEPAIDWFIQSGLPNFLGLIADGLDAIKAIIDKLRGPLKWFMENIWKPFLKRIGHEINGTINQIRGLLKIATGFLEGDTDKINKGFQLFNFGTYEKEFAKAESRSEIFKNTLNGIFGDIGDDAEDEAQSTSKGIKKPFSGIGNWFGSIIEDIKGAFSGIGGWFSTKFQSARDSITGAFSGIGNWFSDRKEDIQNAFSNIGSWFSTKFQNARTAITSAFSNIGNYFTNIKNNIVTTFTNLKTKVISIWNGIKTALRSPINTIISYINSFLKGIANGINTVIKGINKLSTVGGLTKGFDIKPITAPQIPYLAKGAVIPPNAPFMAMLGDQRNGRNLELPENLLRRVVREESGGSIDGNMTVKVYLSGRQIYEEVMRIADLVRAQSGRNSFEGAY